MSNQKKDEYSIKILHVAETVKGGIASYLSELIPLQIERYGCDCVTLIVPEGSAKYLPGVPQSCILEFKSSKKRFICALYMAYAVYKFLKVNATQIVHLHSTYAGFFIRPILLLMSFRPKVVYCAHGWAFDRNSHIVVNKSIYLVEYLLSKISDAIVCISEHDLNLALETDFNKDKLHLITNGIAGKMPPHNFLFPWPDGMIRLLFVGRFDYQKGLDLLLEAMVDLREVAFAVVIGDYVVDSPKIFNVPENVLVMGWKSRDELQGYYLSADILVMPSRWEGFGLTAIEAMRCSLPVLATNVGGLPGIIKDNVNGILIPPNNSKAIIDAVRKMNDMDLKKLGSMARVRFDKYFTAERMTFELDKLYHHLNN